VFPEHHYCFVTGSGISEKLGWSMIENHILTEIPADLIVALESARTRLSIAIAAQSKSTPPALWRHYLDTADRVRRFMRKLRQNGGETAMISRKDGHVREALRQIAEENDARRLCQILEDIVSALE
jgi:hypothetical protein